MKRKELRLFLDTDIGPDCDDTAALAILLQLCREGHGKLLGVTHCTGSPYGLATIDAICRPFHCRPLLGTCPDKGFLVDESCFRYTKPISSRFANGYPPDAPQRDCLDTLIEALAREEDGGVTFIAIGPLNNVARYLRDPVAGPLMRRKVRHMAVMAGAFEYTPGYVEWNVLMDIPAARIVAAEWEGPLFFTPFEALADVRVGDCLRGHTDAVSTAYRYHTGGGMLRPSWDLECVVSAVLGAEPPFAWSAPGNIAIDSRGVTAFSADDRGNRRYLRRTGSAGAGAVYLEQLLARAIATMNA